MSGVGVSRGRRPDSGPQRTPATGVKSCDAIVAWLLRVNRIYGPDEHLAVASRFVQALADSPRDIAASESQVSRWERAAVRVSHAVICRYEQVLGLVPGRLAAVADSLYRERLGRLGPSVLKRESSADTPAVRDQLSELCERAFGGDPFSGQDWDTLTDLLWTIPVLLHPRQLWNQLTERLLAEMLISEGLAWLSRCEAVNRLLGHPHGAAPVIDACASIIGDRRSQVLIEPMVLLELTPDRSAADQLLRQISSPTSPHAMRAAWCAVAEKSERGHFDAVQSQTLARAALDMLQDNESDFASRTGAAETLRHLGPRLGPALGRRVDQAANRDAAAGHVLRSGTTSAKELTTSVAERLSNATLRNMPREILRRDPMLEQLITDMVFHPQCSRRVLAAQTIAATPYRTPLAQALGHELNGRAGLTEVAVASAFVQALAHLGGPREAGLVQRLALTSGLPAAVTEAAARTVGHLPGDAAFWSRAVARLVRPRAELPANHAKALVYSLGTAGRRAELVDLAAQANIHSDVQVAATWWLDRV